MEKFVIRESRFFGDAGAGVDLTPENVAAFIPGAANCLDWEARTFRFPVEASPTDPNDINPAESVSAGCSMQVFGVIGLTHALLASGFRGNAHYEPGSRAHGDKLVYDRLPHA